jgi:hypothetical protein
MYMKYEVTHCRMPTVLRSCEYSGLRVQVIGTEVHYSDIKGTEDSVDTNILASHKSKV